MIEKEIILGKIVNVEKNINIPLISVSVKTDLFRQNTLVAFDGETYQYIGQAPYGSSEDEAVWKVTRIIYDVTGNKVVSQIWNNQKWTDYKN